MVDYKSRSGKLSGVIAYEIEETSIAVLFKDGSGYLYTYSSAGSSAIETMKQHAIDNIGLSTYIAQNKPNYESTF